MIDPHNYSHKLEKALEKIQNSSLSQEEISAVKEFSDHLLSEGISEARVSRYIQTVNTLNQKIDFDLTNPDKKKIRHLLAKINSNSIKEKDLSPYTLSEYKKFFKKFYKVQIKKPEITDMITVSPKKKDLQFTDPSELPKPHDVDKLITGATNKRDKALIALMWESGARISELMNLRWEDYSREADLNYIKILHGKTGSRKVPVRESVEYLERWRKEHPHPGKSDYLFVKLTNSNPLKYSSVQSSILRARSHCNIDVKTNPHAFRKGRATYLAKHGWNAAQLCKYFGWSDFDTARHYIRLAEEDLTFAFRKMHNLDVPGQEEYQELEAA